MTTTFKGQPITGGRNFFSKKKPFVPDAKETSQDEQTMIKEPPTPFKNSMEPAQMSAPSGKSPVEAKSKVGIKALPQLGAVGQNKAINQSGQVNGRMGTSFPRKSRSNTGSFPQKRNARFYGE